MILMFLLVILMLDAGAFFAWMHYYVDVIRRTLS